MRSYAVIETELGWVAMLSSELGVCATTLPHRSPADALAALDLRSNDVEVEEEALGSMAGAIRGIVDGDAGEYGAEGILLDLHACTPFQQQVLRAVLSIPRGETRSYGWVAAMAGNPRAAHAAGQAISNNPLPLFIPCHRVVAADGSLGGYGHGAEALPTKRSLLRREGVYFDGPTLEQMRAERDAGSAWRRSVFSQPPADEV